ncbi:MAG: hypothetical protein L7F77_03525 [Candidatus Magnetominusculus sp. LBB02]|nr:hypothetical protein [Candidatus Magnetominusculus sp. LBB02]
MRIIISMAAILCLVVATQACKKAEDVSTKMSDTAEQKLQAKDKANAMAQKADIEGLRRSISGFKAAEGRYPKDLAELETFAGVTIDKGIYKYDAAKGTIETVQ